ncbi:MAG TPA: hypothetical protein VGK64_05890 [Bryobacteraceae bacterium]
MPTNRSGLLIAILALLVPSGAAAQGTPKVEIFGGYSYLDLTQQPRTRLQFAGLNGWNTSVKFNVMPRLGFLADFSGHYGERGRIPETIESLITPGQFQRVEAIPGGMRQHTFLFGPEVRLLQRNRLTVNVRALMGVAHTSPLVLQLREPIRTRSGSITQFSFPSSSTFAASFGGSIDYRITDRLSYRIVQPELLLTRSGTAFTGNWSQYNFRLSTGLVFTSGTSSFGPSIQPRFSFGVVGGAALTDAFGHETTGFTGLNGTGPIRSRSYSTLKDYAIGPMIEVGLPLHGSSIEIDALYRPMNLTTAGVREDGSLNSISPATVVTWELPALLKYRFGPGRMKPFIEAGPSFRVAGNLNNAAPSPYGATGGLGVEAQIGKLRISPVVRCTHWAADPDFAGSRSKRNQVELLIGLSF